MIDRAKGYFNREKEMMSERKRETYLKKRLSEILRYGYSIRSRFGQGSISLGLKPEEIRISRIWSVCPSPRKQIWSPLKKEILLLGDLTSFPRKG